MVFRILIWAYAIDSATKTGRIRIGSLPSLAARTCNRMPARAFARWLPPMSFTAAEHTLLERASQSPILPAETSDEFEAEQSLLRYGLVKKVVGGSGGGKKTRVLLKDGRKTFLADGQIAYQITTAGKKALKDPS